jgi:D-sedoheptulose 7-phosphate isomerase
MAAELMGRMSALTTRKAYPAIALTTDTSFITAWANDKSFEDIFSRQVEGLGVKGDVLLAISTSGNSENVMLAVRKAQAQRMHIVTLTGMGGKITKEASVAIKVPSKYTPAIQEAHLCIEHIICEIIEKELMVGVK